MKAGCEKGEVVESRGESSPTTVLRMNGKKCRKEKRTGPLFRLPAMVKGKEQPGDVNIESIKRRDNVI